MQIPQRHVELRAQPRLLRLDQLAEAFSLAVVLAEDGDGVGLRQLRQLGDRLLCLGLEARERADRQAQARHLLPPHQAGHRGRALLELAHLQPREPLHLAQHRVQRVDTLDLGQSVEVALGLLGDLQRRPEHDHRVVGQVVEQAGRVGGVGEVALEVDHLERRERLERAEAVEVEALDRLDLVAEEVDAGGEADLVAGDVVVAGQVDVDDAAADGEVAGDFDLFEAVVAVLAEPDDQLLRLQLVARLEDPDELVELLARRHRLHQRLHRRDQERVQGSGFGVQGRRRSVFLS